jgi:hypothetical protein
MKILIDTVMGIFLKPNDTLPLLKSADETMRDTVQYICILALIPVISAFIGYTVIGFGISDVGRFRIPVGYSLLSVLLQYVFIVGIIVLGGILIDYLAPTFGGTKNNIHALKTAAYSFTPVLIGGIFAFIHSSLFLAIVILISGAYGVYILYLCLPLFMASPKERTVGYTVVSVVGILLIGMVLWLIHRVVVRGIMVSALDRIL